jgi:hypothetical protein
MADGLHAIHFLKRTFEEKAVPDHPLYMTPLIGALIAQAYGRCSPDLARDIRNAFQ